MRKCKFSDPPACLPHGHSCSCKEYHCDCHRLLGNDFYFLPRDTCLNGRCDRPDGTVYLKDAAHAWASSVGVWITVCPFVAPLAIFGLLKLVGLL